MTMKAVALIIITAVVAFWAGYRFHNWYYDDVCVNLGGDIDSANYAICVIER